MHIQVSKIANQSKGTSRHKVFCGNLTKAQMKFYFHLALQGISWKSAKWGGSTTYISWIDVAWTEHLDYRIYSIKHRGVC